MSTSLGMLEVQSIPLGVEAGDAMLKAADVELVSAQTVCAGKYIVIVTGEVAAVRSSIAAGEACAGASVIDSLVIPNIHAQVPLAINACSVIERVEAVAIIETFSLCAAVHTADAAVKAAQIDLIEVRLGRGMGGKSFVLLTGDVASAKAAVEAANGIEELQGLISSTAVIPSPHPELIRAIV